MPEADETVTDFGDDAAPVALDRAFEELDALASDGLKLAAEIETLEAEVKAKTARLKVITDTTIPELMARMRQKECRTHSGVWIEVKRSIRASIPSADKNPILHAQGLAWLVNNGQAGLVKNLISLKLDRGNEERAKELAAALRSQGLDPEVKRWVEPQTLSKCVRELLERGVDVPFEPLGVFDQNVATLKR